MNDAGFLLSRRFRFLPRGVRRGVFCFTASAPEPSVGPRHIAFTGIQISLLKSGMEVSGPSFHRSSGPSRSS